MLQYGFDRLDAPRRAVVTIGSFDGVHTGHRVLLERLKAMAARCDAESVVVTFDPHPRIAMGRAEGMQLLTTIEERARLLEDMGIDRMVVAHFDEAFRSQPYESFVRDMLIARLGMVGMIVGYNHRLGRGSEGNFDRLQPLAAECGFELECVAQHTAVGEDKISSTVVRNVIAAGEMERAARLLGARYMLSGIVCDGRLDAVDEYKMLPPSGIYRCDLLSCGVTTPTIITIDGRKVFVATEVSGAVTIFM
ncbi:MAG: adenylyltransferase/cytidyltransferase family protein [Alistipes sp.]|nr:adenylyltransferase/cytidyltransferase family protein [Alistipes sp.]